MADLWLYAKAQDVHVAHQHQKSWSEHTTCGMPPEAFYSNLSYSRKLNIASAGEFMQFNSSDRRGKESRCLNRGKEMKKIRGLQDRFQNSAT